MQENELISIVVPVYQLEKYICDTMDSVLAQTYTNWELWLVEDGSKDRTAEIIEEYIASKGLGDRIFLVHQEEGKSGAAQARNTGVLRSRGRYIAYLDGDDVWEPQKLERELTFLKEKDAAFVFTGYEFADERAVGNGKVVHPPATLSYKQALKNTTIFTSTVMFDTEKISREELMMPLIKSEDTALWWRVLRSGILAYGLDENLVRYRRPGKSLSSNKLEAIRRIWMLYRKAEGLSIPYSAWNFLFWAYRAVARRV